MALINQTLHHSSSDNRSRDANLAPRALAWTKGRERGRERMGVVRRSAGFTPDMTNRPGCDTDVPRHHSLAAR